MCLLCIGWFGQLLYIEDRLTHFSALKSCEKKAVKLNGPLYSHLMIYLLLLFGQNLAMEIVDGVLCYIIVLIKLFKNLFVDRYCHINVESLMLYSVLVLNTDNFSNQT